MVAKLLLDFHRRWMDTHPCGHHKTIVTRNNFVLTAMCTTAQANEKETAALKEDVIALRVMLRR